jgi:hypothetical protein
MKRHAIVISILIWGLVASACGNEAAESAPAELWADDGAEPSDEEPCEGAAPECVEACGFEETYAASCDAGAWSCGPGLEADACSVCAGEPSACIEACGSDVQVADAECEGMVWTCPEGVAASSCAPCEGEEPLECVESCEEGAFYEAECVDDEWDCGDGALLESCASSCEDESMACETPCGTEPWPCVPSCEVFEIYDATCTGEEWSCGDGMLAADC